MSKGAVLAILLAIAVISALILRTLLETDHPAMSEAWVRGTVAGLGMAGPLALIGLIVLAIFASPIPSGPIAVTAGVLYGTLWGGAFVVTGALLGACLIPFISFDAVSYAAGITCLSSGRFALASFLGILPICFALAAMGAGIASAGTDWMWIVVRGGITLIPIVAKWI